MWHALKNRIQQRNLCAILTWPMWVWTICLLWPSSTTFKNPSFRNIVGFWSYFDPANISAEAAWGTLFLVGSCTLTYGWLHLHRALTVTGLFISGFLWLVISILLVFASPATPGWAVYIGCSFLSGLALYNRYVET